MEHILEFEQFLNEIYPGQRMKEKDPRYFIRKTRLKKTSDIINWIDGEVNPGDMFEYYTSGGTTVALFVRRDNRHLYYESVPTIYDVADREVLYLKPGKIQLSRIGGIGLPSKDELEDMLDDYERLLRTKVIKKSTPDVRKWIDIIETGSKRAVRWK